MIDKSLPLPDLAAVICDACKRSGIDIVLSGGACVSIYTNNEYESFDLDFVLLSPVRRKKTGPFWRRSGSGRMDAITDIRILPISSNSYPLHSPWAGSPSAKSTGSAEEK